MRMLPTTGSRRSRWVPALVLKLSLLVVACTGQQVVTGPGEGATFAVEPPLESSLARRLAGSLAEHEGRSGFVLLNTGLEAFAARMGLTHAAEHSLDVQTYILRDDDSGRMLMGSLLEAADRGVRVRLLLDDLNLTGLYRSLAVLDAHPNLQVRLFNPFVNRGFWARVGGFFTDFSRVSRRMHNKYFAADNLVGIVGGRNLGDEYFEARPELDFLDIDVMAVGPIVQEVSARSFDAYWNSPWAVSLTEAEVPPAREETIAEVRDLLRAHADEMRGSVYADAVRKTPFVTDSRSGQLQLVWAHARVVVDVPDKGFAPEREADPEASPLVYRELVEVTRRTAGELLLVSPYFVPGDEGVAFLAGLRKQGVRVRILTNSLASTDSIAAFAGYETYRRDLLEAGVELYEVKSGAEGTRRLRDVSFRGSTQASLHAKTFVYDREHFFIGSLNLDPRSFWINTETGLFIDSPELSRQVAALFDQAATPQASYRVRFAHPDRTGASWRDLEWESEENGEVVVYDTDPESTWPRRAMTFLLRMLPIEDQL